MGDWPASAVGAGRNTTVGLSTSTLGATTTANPGGNVKSAWSDLSAATPHDADAVLLMVQQTVGSENFLLDVALGASDIVVPDLLVAWGALSLIQHVWLPLQIAAGTQVRIRHQCTRSDAFTQLKVQAGLYQSTLLGQDHGANMVAYGITTSGNTTGVSIDPGATIHTKGSWTTVAAATTAVHRGLILALGTQRNTAMVDNRWRFDIGIGGTGNAVDATIHNDIYVASMGTAVSVMPAWIGPLPGDIPAGSRLAVRSQSLTADATDRLLDVALYGV